MTYEFVKHVADNLRFGSYDGKWEVGSSSIKIKDVNSNTYIKLYIESFYQQTSYKKIFKTYYKNTENPVIEITINTGVNNPELIISADNWLIDSTHNDYTFWTEFYTWVAAKWEDKVYKHKCLIEEVFVL